MTLVPVVTAALAATPSGTPERVSHVYDQHLVAPPERVLPLLTPLGERAWAAGWDPQMRWEPPGGGAGTLFVIRHPEEPSPAPGGRLRSRAGAPRVLAQETVWLLDTFDLGEGHVHYIHVTPGSDVTEIDIRLRPEGSGATVATVRYTWTSLGPPGVALVRSKTAAAYLASMRHWEHALNHHLAGSAVRSEPATAPGH